MYYALCDYCFFDLACYVSFLKRRVVAATVERVVAASHSSVASLDKYLEVDFPACASMAESNKENAAPPARPAKRLKLSLKHNHERFSLATSEEVEAAKKPIVPPNTTKSTDWAVRVFRSWVTQRNERLPGDKCPEDILLTDDHEFLCQWLCVFASETRKEDGSQYTPRSIAQMFAGLQRYINSASKDPVRLVDPMNSTFKPLHQLLNRLYQDLHAQGVGTVKKQAEAISVSEEDRLWMTGTIGLHSPLALLFAVFYYNGLNFVLRGGQEHREFKISQLEFRTVSDPDAPGKDIECVRYTEHGSKNRPGGRHQLNLENKVVVQYAQLDRGERCHVRMLRLYLSKLHESAFQEDVFYWKPRDNLPDSADEPWYTRKILGHNVLGQLLKRMCGRAGIDSTNKTNHSLRATAISRMFQSGVPQKVVMNRSGHLSKEGLVPYERITPQQQKAVCKVLSDASSSTLNLPEQGWPQQQLEQREEKPEALKDEPDLEEVLDKKPDPKELMKGLQFHNMQGCTFNINFQ